MRTEPLIDRLANELKPVRRRTGWSDALALVVLCAVELGLFLAMGMMRPDMPTAMHLASFWWKPASLGLIGLVSGSVAIMSLDPVRSPRRGLRWIMALIAVCLASGWLLEPSRDGFSTLTSRLDWVSGLECLYTIVALSVPAVIGLGLLIRRGAPTDHAGTALAAGLAAAAWGAFVFVFACRFDDPLYVAVWYSLGCGAVTLFARCTLPRLTRW
ncbi:MAG TPA: DUF1109 domain-containing protein [Stellaceae bacterium]